MMFKTHLMFGILLSIFFAKAFAVEHIFLFVLVGAFFAIFPDIDFHKSKIGQKTKPFSWMINFFLGHRGLIHSLLLAFAFFLLFVVLFGETYGAAVLIGYFSHIFLDSFTKKGTRPLWPLTTRLSGILKGNSIIDYFLFFLF